MILQPLNHQPQISNAANESLASRIHLNINHSSLRKMLWFCHGRTVFVMVIVMISLMRHFPTAKLAWQNYKTTHVTIQIENQIPN